MCLPNVDAGSSQAFALNSNCLDAVYAAGAPSRGETTTAAADDEIVAFLGDGRHGWMEGRKLSLDCGESVLGQP